MNVVSPLKQILLTPIQRLLACITLLILAWALVFWQGLATAIDIWLISEIFNHCLFVLPGALYLIYRKRNELARKKIRPNLLLIAPLLGLLFLYALGLAGDVQLFMHVATFTALPLIIWLLIGNEVAKVIVFPLVFMLFCIPVGEELIPWLQQITANISIPLLQLTGVPIFRSGLYVDIPQGKFLIAEACSGISFFITSIVIGALYTHLYIASMQKKIGFMLIAIIYPVIANALRVYGIILTAYLTDMEYAVGADHLIYGGVFFAIVIISLLLIGELFRDDVSETQHDSKPGNYNSSKNKIGLPSALILIIFIVFYLWFMSISERTNYVENKSAELEISWMNSEGEGRTVNRTWQPHFANAERLSSGSFVSSSGATLDYFMAYYVLGKGELVSSLNRLYQQDRWTIVSSSRSQLNTTDGLRPVYIEQITGSNGEGRLLASWYVVNGKSFSDKRWAKLYQIYNIMLANPADGAIIAISVPLSDKNTNEEHTQFKSDLSDLYNKLVASLPTSSKQL